MPGLDGPMERKKNIANIAMGIGAACILACGVTLRILGIEGGEGASAYFDMAKVAQGATIPQIAQGAEYFYVKFLHFTLWMFGNKWMAGVAMQIALQSLAGLLFALAAWSLSGRLAAFAVFALFQFLPWEIARGVSYGPDMLYLCCYSLGLLAVAFSLRVCTKSYYLAVRAISLAFAGAIIGVVSYLDLSGASLLAFLAGVWLTEIGKRKGGRLRLAARLAFTMAASFLVFFLCLTSDASRNGRAVGASWTAWLDLYRFKPDVAKAWLQGDLLLPGLLLLGVLFLGLAEFRRDGSPQRALPWILAVLALFSFEVCGMTRERMDAFFQAVYGGAALMGGVLAGLLPFGRKAEEEEIPATELVLNEVMIEDLDAERKDGEKIGKSALKDGIGASGAKEAPGTEDVSSKPGKSGKSGAEAAANEEDASGDKKKERRLPGRRRKKGMDYAYEPGEGEMDYDVDVSEQDDFDV